MAVAIDGPGSNGVTIRNVRVQTTTTAVEIGGDNWVISDVAASIVNNFATATAGHAFIRITNCETAGLIDLTDCEHVVIANNNLGSLIDLGAGTEVMIVGNTYDSPGGAGTHLIEATSGAQGVVVASNNILDADGYDLISFTSVTDFTITDNLVADITEGIFLDGCSLGIVADNVLGADIPGGNPYLGEHGIHLTGSSNIVVTGNLINQPGQDADDTYDGIILAGDSNDNEIVGNKIIPSAVANDTRYGINISAAACDNNAVFANYLGDSSEYGTADSVDSGTGTIPAASGGVIGGQFAY